MKYSLLVCLMAGSLATSAGTVFAQNPPLQKGVSVEMAVTNNAGPMPAADERNAWIVAISAEGQIYFGTEGVTPEQLLEKMKTHPRNREAKLYLKADARAPYATVLKTLQVAKAAMFDGVVLLTKQAEAPPLGVMVPPKGFDVLLDSPASSAVVRVSRSGQKTPELKVNDATISFANLQSALNQALQNRGEKVVVVTADPQLPFSDVAHVIDAVRSVGAQAALPTAEM